MLEQVFHCTHNTNYKPLTSKVNLLIELGETTPTLGTPAGPDIWEVLSSAKGLTISLCCFSSWRNIASDLPSWEKGCIQKYFANSLTSYPRSRHALHALTVPATINKNHSYITEMYHLRHHTLANFS